ncbi:MAG: hypothetical protein ACRD40_06775, partial [Candidatus Acidiferrales bacterium]
MINSWTLARFKSVYDKTTLELGPLTVFAGTNNSGKSTIIQSILLTAQSLQSPVFHRPITLNGHLVRLGTFDDILSSGASESSIEVGFSLFGPLGTSKTVPHVPGTPMFYWGTEGESIRRVRCDFRFSPIGSGERKEILQLQPSLDRAFFEVEYVPERSESSEESPAVSDMKTDSMEVEHSSEDLQQKLTALGLRQVRPDDLRALEYRVLKGETPRRRYVATFSPHEIIGASMYHFVPRALLAKYDEIEEQAKQTVAAFSMASEYPYRDYYSNDSVLPKIPDEFKERVLSVCGNVASESATQKSFVSRNLPARLEALRSDFTPANYRSFALTLPNATRTALAQRMADISIALE